MTAKPLQAELIQLIPRLRRFACAMTGNQSDGDDLVQTTLERLLKKGAPEGANLSKWAFRVCRNAWIDQVRSVQTRRRLSEQYLDDSHLVEDGERTVMSKLTLNEVSTAMDGMPNDQRAALALVALEGFSYSEAAEALNVSIGTIMSRVHRARQKLSESFGDPVSGTIGGQV